ncbi:prepilin-type N-terminal cleavage/methylation domain-containing protein [Viridibacillus sp. NPDC093762]|uniref:prepilin-type N-terminal cleavage/methylation domain-containing protein n=1 Tax=Viridibacillus sp. NPDC093762 TaxID=3390720 RepID=UPI003D0696CE
MNNKEAGFTFVELLLVLTVTMIICSLCLALGKANLDERMVNQFLYQLMLDIEQVQSESIGSGVFSYLEFFDDGKKYRAYTLEGEGNLINTRRYYFTRELPEGVTYSYSSPLRQIKIDSQGTFSSFGTLVFVTPTGNKSLIINIVKGRMKIVE